MDGGAWWATVHGAAKSRTRLSDFTHSLNQESKQVVKETRREAWQRGIKQWEWSPG